MSRFIETLNLQDDEKLTLIKARSILKDSNNDLFIEDGEDTDEYHYSEYACKAKVQMSFVMLDMCEMILVLPGWQQSKGCKMEIKHAVEHGQTISFAGGKGCQRSQSKQKPESLIQKLAKRFTGETEESAYSAGSITGWRNRPGMVENSNQSCITFLDPRTDLVFLRTARQDANIITK